MQNVIDLAARRTNANFVRTLSALHECVADRLIPAFRDALASCDDLLFEHAQKATNGMRQAQYFDDLRALRRAQEPAVQAFAAACRVSIENGSVIQLSSSGNLDDALSLVADEDLELDLAFMRIGKCCDEAAPQLHHQVESRLRAFYGLSEKQATPLEGVAIAQMCKASATSLAPLSLESRLIVLKQIERRLGHSVVETLNRANALMFEHGILPNLRVAHAPPQKSSPTRPAPAANAPSPRPSRSPSTADVEKLNAALQQMSAWMTQQNAASSFGTSQPAHSAPAGFEPPLPPPPAVSAGEAERERRRAEIAERRAAEMARAKAQRDEAEQATNECVQASLSQPHVPNDLAGAMRAPLARHLSAIHLRKGKQSREWRSACRLVGDIGWALDPESAVREREHWRAMVPGIITALRSALLEAGTDEHQVDRIVAKFGERYEQMLREYEPAPEPSRSEVMPAPEAETHAVKAGLDEVSPSAPEAPQDVNAPGAPESVAEVRAEVPTTLTRPRFSDALQRVRSLRLGQWFDMVDDQGQPQRAKLVWTSAMTERCLFVNANGKLIADRPHVRVANDIVTGHFREVEGDTPGNG